MSRSALDRSVLQARRHGVNAETMEETAYVDPRIESERNVKSGELPMHGNQETYNLNKLLAHNILESDYFRALYELKTYHEVIDEIYLKVTHVEPFSAGTSRLPSTAFCLLFKFFTMRLTQKQMNGLLLHQDSVYIRCIGFLYLRYTCPPGDIWKWFELHMEDETEFTASSNPNQKTTVSEWLKGLLSQMNYFGTTLPRIPVPIERKIKVQLLLLDQRLKRGRENQRVKHKFHPGANVQAVYGDNENDPAWYEAVIEEEYDERHYVVNFPEYGNTEIVHIGDIRLQQQLKPGRSRSRSKDRRDQRGKRPSRSRERRKSRSRSRSRDRHRARTSRSDSRDRTRRSRSRSPVGDKLISGNLMEEVMRREREKAEARGKDYGARPASYKGSLSLKIDRYTYRKKSKSRSPVRPSRRNRSRERDRRPRSPENPPPKPTVSAEAMARLEKLKERYGDASASGKSR